MKFEEVITKLEYHFKCDCLACVNYKEGESCEEQNNGCEVARSYFETIKSIQENCIDKQKVREAIEKAEKMIDDTQHPECRGLIDKEELKKELGL